MRFSALIFASVLVCWPTATLAASGQDASATPVRWEDFDDPGFDPQAPRAAEAPIAAEAPVALPRPHASAIPLGPFGVAADGVRGRIHTVSRGETLWDISNAYLGTSWVWPSVWRDNAGIDNPHVIAPGDNIWITSHEMRQVSPAEAAELLSAAVEPESAEAPVAAFGAPSDAEQATEPVAEQGVAAVPTLEPTVAPTETGEILRVPLTAHVNLVTVDALAAASKILESPTLRMMLTQGDEVYLDLGEGEVDLGDEFVIFRDVLEIRDPKTRALLGHHVDQLGWMRIEAVESGASVARIEEAVDEIRRGDFIVPREKQQSDVPIRRAEAGTHGQIAHMPGYRYLVGTTDSIYLNLGSIHGVELGTKLVVYSGRNDDIDLPGAVIAEMILIRVEPEVSVAYVTKTQKELEVGEEVSALRAGPIGQTYSQR